MRSTDTEMQKLQAQRAKLLSAARRVVIKLGTNTVADAEGSFCKHRLEAIVGSIARLKADGVQVVLVSSGAVGLGRAHLKLHRARTLDIVTRQACAAVGQALLMDAYQELFGAHNIKVAQVLLTEDDFMERRRSFNLRQTMEKLLKLGVVPIVNENDTVSTAELEYVGESRRTRIFSDNDRLAALVTSKIDANALVLLTNVEGLLETRHGSQHLVPLVKQITPELKALASGPSAGGRGGMTTKLEAAEITTRAGAVAVIADGRKADTLTKVFRGDAVGTVFIPAERMPAKRRWIAYAADVKGKVVVNAGARDALLGGKASLLWSGVVKVERDFKPMDVISIADAEGCEFARGIANHASDGQPEANGTRTSSKASVLVTRDNIVVFENV